MTYIKDRISEITEILKIKMKCDIYPIAEYACVRKLRFPHETDQVTGPKVFIVNQYMDGHCVADGYFLIEDGKLKFTTDTGTKSRERFSESEMRSNFEVIAEVKK